VLRFIFYSCSAILFAINSSAQPVEPIRPAFKLVSDGVRGGMGVSVVWHPLINRYYTAVSGTGENWLIIYNHEGKTIKKPYLLPFDPGSLWMENSGKALKSYASGMEGLYVIHLQEGNPAYFENIFYSLHNPVAIGNGVWVRHRKELCYYHDKTIFRYKTRHVNHRAPITLMIDDYENELNSMGIIYTGIRNKEIGFYDHGQHRIMLYSAKSGRCTSILQIMDETGPKPLCGDIAYANGYYWLYDRETGNWHGYR
jgi:hypothetical protein